MVLEDRDRVSPGLSCAILVSAFALGASKSAFDLSNHLSTTPVTRPAMVGMAQPAGGLPGL